MLAIVAGVDVWAEMAYRSYEPQHVTVPSNAPYLLPDGSIYIVGDDTMEPLLKRLNELFSQTHPGIRFTMVLRSPPTGIDGIQAGVSLFAPVAHDAWEAEIEPFKRLTGYRPLDVRIGRRGYAGAGRENPPGIYVNKNNPLPQLTLDQVARIFTAGQMPSDLRHWSQLGVGGEWAKHAIHLYGTRDDGKTVTALRIARFGGLPFDRHYESLADDADVLQALAGDHYGIGVVWFVDAATVPREVRLVPLAESDTGPASVAEYADVRQGRYPLAPYLHLYVRSAPGQPLDPIVREYIRLALSLEGQRIIEELKDGKQSYVPLTAEQAAIELAKIRQPAAPPIARGVLRAGDFSAATGRSSRGRHRKRARSVDGTRGVVIS
jgi:phosphate transport system substrate-binding protein